MKCVLLGSNAKVFAKAIQSLAKYGKELFLEAQDNGLLLRTMNLPGTAFGCFMFYKDFFDEFDNSHNLPSNDKDSEFENSCQISMKSCLGIFKSMRQVIRCVFKIDIKSSKLNVKLFCRNDIVKTHQIAIVDVESETPSFNTDEVPNNVQVSHKILSEIIDYFQMGEEEITFDAEQEAIKIRNFVEGAKENEKALRTELGLKSGEFNEYSIEEKATVTFNMKELKAFLLFAEAANLDIDIKFQDTGTPIAFIAKDFNMFEGKLVMSTLSPEDVSMYEDYEKGNESEVSFAPEPSKRRSSKSETGTSKKLKEDTTVSSIQSLRDGDETLVDESDIPVFSEPIENKSLHTQVVRPSILPEISSKESNMERLVPPILNLESDPNLSLTFKDTEEIDCIQESPVKKQIRSIFSRCFEATYLPKEPSPNSKVYVPDSDEE